MVQTVLENDINLELEPLSADVQLATIPKNIM